MIELSTKSKPGQQAADSGSVELLVGDKVLAQLLEPEFQNNWDALFEACPWATVFQSRPFVATWYRIYQNEYLPIFVWEQHRGKLTGLLTLAKTKNGVITGAGANGAEYQVWLAEDADGEGFIKSALLKVRKRFPKNCIQLKYVPGKVSLGWAKKDPVWNNHCFIQVFKHPLLVINDATVTNKLRKPNRRNKINRLKRLGEVKFERITDSGVFAAVFDELSFHNDFRKGAMFNKAIFKTDPLKKKFLSDLFEQNISHATVLKLNDKIIASNIGTTGKNWVTMHNGFNSHAPIYAKYSPGILHFLLLSKLLVEEGVNVFDLTPGADYYKEELATDYTQAYQLFIGSVYHTFARKVNFTFISFIKKLTFGIGIKPATLKKLKRSAYFLKNKISNVRGQGLISLIKTIVTQVRSPKNIRKYSLTPDAGMMHSSANCINIQKDNLSDLLNFEQEPGATLTRWEFLANALCRFEKEEHCYSWVEGGRLLGCAWLPGPESFPAEQVQSNVIAEDSIILYGLYCHSSGLDRLQSFLVDVAAEAMAFSAGSRVFAMAEGPALCRDLEAAGFLPAEVE